MSVSEKGAGLSRPLVEDHYELELPWLPWLRTDPGAESARGIPDAKRSPKYRAFDFTTDSIYPPIVMLMLSSLLFHLFLLIHCARIGLVWSGLGFRSLPNTAFMCPLSLSLRFSPIRPGLLLHSCSPNFTSPQNALNDPVTI